MLIQYSTRIIEQQPRHFIHMQFRHLSSSYVPLDSLFKNKYFGYYLNVLIFFYESLFLYKWLYIFISLREPIFLSWSFIDFRFQCYVLYNLMHEISTAQHIKNSHFIHSSNSSQCTESEHTNSLTIK